MRLMKEVVMSSLDCAALSADGACTVHGCLEAFWIEHWRLLGPRIRMDSKPLFLLPRACFDHEAW